MVPVFPLLYQSCGALDDLDKREDDNLSDSDMAPFWRKESFGHF
jgi:hypothetical protein